MSFWGSKDRFHRLKRTLGSDSVLTDDASLAVYSIDATQTRGIPAAVVFPESTEDVQVVVRFAVESELPITARGAGTGLSGGSVPLDAGIVMSFERMRRILNLDADNQTALVQPGVVTSILQERVLQEGLYYPPDPSSNSVSTLGGNIAENAGGLRCFKYGVTSHYVLGLEIVDSEANRIYTGTLQTDRYDPDLTSLFVGSEGTLGLITKAQLRLIEAPAATVTLAAYFETAGTAFEAVEMIVRSGVTPSVLEYIDRKVLEATSVHTGKVIPEDTEAMLLIELDGKEDVLAEQRVQVSDMLSSIAISSEIAEDQVERDRLWELRRGISPSLIRLGSGKIHEDVAVPRGKLMQLAEMIEAIAIEFGLDIAVYGHAGDGNLHVVVLFDAGSKSSIEKARKTTEAIFRTTLKLGGTITGEHGIGATKRRYLPWQQSDTVLQLYSQVKQMLDPQGIFNPGKVLQ